MQKDLFRTTKKKAIFEKQSNYYPLSRVTITKFRDPHRSELINFPNFESIETNKTHSSKKSSDTPAFMQNYLNHLKSQKRGSQKRLSSKTQNFMDNDNPIKKRIYKLKLPQFCQGQKMNLRTIDNVYDHIPSAQEFTERKSKMSEDIETERQKEKIAQLLRKIRKDKEKSSRNLSPSLRMKKTKKKQEEKFNPFRMKNLQPWDLDRKAVDFSIEDYQNYDDINF